MIEIRKDGRPNIPADVTVAQWTYWGQPDECSEIAPGLYWVQTPSHGGFIVAQERLKKMPPMLLTVGYGAHIGCFEEDCAWSLPVLFFKDEYTAWVGEVKAERAISDASDMVRSLYKQIHAAHPELLQ